MKKTPKKRIADKDGSNVSNQTEDCKMLIQTSKKMLLMFTAKSIRIAIDNNSGE